MTRCSEVRACLGFFLEKETGPLETLQTRQHLDGCEACRSRAERLSRLMTDCANLPQAEPHADVAAAVMTRLRAIRASMIPNVASAAALKWSGLVLVLCSILTGLAGQATTWPTGPAALLARLVWGADSAGGTGEATSGALPVVVRVLHGGLRSDLSAAPLGLDLQLALQLLATALAVAFMLAIPVALVTAWLLRHESFPRRMRLS